jgi:hypothetical protein
MPLGFRLMKTVARNQYRVVGFIVQPSSKRVTLDAQGNANCETDRPVVLDADLETQVTYTYSVEWRVVLFWWC